MECREIVVITTLPKLIIKNKVRVMWSSCVHRTPNIDRLSCKDQYKTPIKTYETGNPYWYISSAADVQFMIQNQGMIISSKLVNYTVISNLTSSQAVNTGLIELWSFIESHTQNFIWDSMHEGWLAMIFCSQSASFLPAFLAQIGCLSPISEVNRYGFW